MELTSQVYLLAYNTDRRKLTCNGYLGYVLRAAALTELLQLGALSDADGKAKPTGVRVADGVSPHPRQTISVRSAVRFIIGCGCHRNSVGVTRKKEA